MKKTIFSTLMLLSIMATFAHAGNTAVSNQSGSYGANTFITQIGKANVTYTDQYAGNAFAKDSTTVSQVGLNNYSRSVQIASNVDGDRIGNKDRITQTGNDNTAYTVSIGDDNETIIIQNNKKNFASAYTEGYNNKTNIIQNNKENFANSYTEGYDNKTSIRQNTKENIADVYTSGHDNDTTINQSGNVLYGSNQAYSTIIESFGNDVTINQGQAISRTLPAILTASANYASSYINDSSANDVIIAQDGHYNASSIYIDDSSSNDISTAQSGYSNAVAVSAEFSSDLNDIIVKQNGIDNNAYADINNGYNNDISITQDNSNNYATASVVGANNGSIAVIQK